MSVTSTKDPVQAVVDILDNEAASAWPSNTAPDRIERAEESDPSQKEGDQRRSQVSLYVQNLADGDLRKQHAAGGLDERYVIEVQVWTGDSADTNAYYRAIIEDIMPAYYTDNNDLTNFYDIAPESSGDARAGSFHTSGFAIETARVRLKGFRDV